MTNIYVLATGALPSPWTRVTTWDGRYLRCSSSHGTGGATQHRHLTVQTTSGTPGVQQKSTTYSGGMAVHTHNIPPSYTGYSDNDPLYYTLALWSMNATTWETTQRYFPTNVVVLSTNTLSATNFSRYSAPDGRLIKLGDPGSTGGRSVHDEHTINATLEATTPPDLSASGCCSGPGNVNHSHTFTASEVPENGLLPARVKTRLYRVTSDTDRAPAGVVCFFDAAPSSNWDFVNWNDRFIMSYDCDPTNEGLDNHGHDAVSGTSSSFYDLSSAHYISAATLVVNSHDHPVAIECGEANHVPSYVTLLPYQLNTTLLRISTNTKTIQLDALLKVIRPKQFQATVVLEKAGSKFVTARATVQNTLPEEVEVDTVISGLNITSQAEIDVLLKQKTTTVWRMNTCLVKSEKRFGISANIVKRIGHTPPVLDAIIKSFADQLDKINMLVQGMSWANKLESAAGDELDQKWGHVFDLPRLEDESDEHYRKRLATYTKVATGCGTAPAIESILNQITGEANTAAVDTYSPGTVHVNFTTADAVRAALNNEALINKVLTGAIAAGISWYMTLPLKDLQVSTILRGPVSADFEVDTRLQAQNIGANWYIRPYLVKGSGENLEADTLVVKRQPQTLNVSSRIKRVGDLELGASSRVRKTSPKTADLSARVLARRSETFSAGAPVKRQRVPAGWDVTAQLKSQKRAQALFRAQLIRRTPATVSASVKVVAA